MDELTRSIAELGVALMVFGFGLLTLIAVGLLLTIMLDWAEIKKTFRRGAEKSVIPK